MKIKIKISLALIIAVFVNIALFAQCPNTGMPSTGASFWCRNGNGGIGGNTFGTMFAAPINIYTNSTNIAQFTYGGILTNPAGYTGNGLRIIDPTPGGLGHLDLWASTSNTTHIKWDGSGEISGQHTRFEIIGNYKGGLYFNPKKNIDKH